MIVAELRGAAVANGYRPIRLRTRGKEPISKNWQHGDTLEALLAVTANATNTGILCKGLRAIDIDIDDQVIVDAVLGSAEVMFPGRPLVRKRPGSPRAALVFKAASGEPPKRAINGSKGKVEVLGAGQQLLAFGTHPSGATLYWEKGRSPAAVPVHDLPVVSEVEIDIFLAICERLLGPPVTRSGSEMQGPAAKQSTSPFTFEGNFPPKEQPHGIASQDAEQLGAGIGDGHWFSRLQPTFQEKVVRACLNANDNSKNDPRRDWLVTLFAVADAGRQGCSNARALALEWSTRGAGWTSEVDFDIAWNSAKPGRVTVGTLLHAAALAGLDFSSFRVEADEAPPADEPPPAGNSNAQGSTWRSQAVPLSDMADIPPKRKFLHGTDIVRGAVTILVAPGGRGKTSFLAVMALACATGRQLLGQRIFGGPHRVLFINGEDSIHELNRRFTAAIMHYGLNRAALANLAVVGAEAGSLNLVQGDKAQHRLNPAGWQALLRHVDTHKPDIIFMDPYSKLYGGVSTNDNAAATVVMGELTRIAAEGDLAFVAAHHASKNTDVKNAEAAMGGAMTMNLARVGLSIEPISQSRGIELGISPLDVASYFDLHNTKQNMAAASSNARICRLVSVQLPNAEPPIYPEGDRVAVVEPFQPAATGSAFGPAMIQAVLLAVATASPPLSPTPGRAGTDPIPVIEAAMGLFMGGRTSGAAAKALLKYLLKSRKLIIGQYQVSRTGRGGYSRKALFVQKPHGTNGAP